MRIAVLSDIHGNSIALHAVLADILTLGEPDEYWVLGDLAAGGPDPVGVLEHLAALPRARFIRGNTERLLLERRQPPTLEEVAADPHLLTRYFELSNSFGWTQGALTAAGWLDWLVSLPLEFTAILPGGQTVLCVHASPGSDDSPGFTPDTPEAECLSRLEPCKEQILCVGHTHQPVNRRLGRWHVINPGSVTKTSPAMWGASYALLSADPSGYQVEHRQVAYDQQAVTAMLEARCHPTAQWSITWRRR
jgi:predicted phosphodiesterase